MHEPRSTVDTATVKNSPKTWTTATMPKNIKKINHESDIEWFAGCLPESFVIYFLYRASPPKGDEK